MIVPPVPTAQPFSVSVKATPLREIDGESPLVCMAQVAPPSEV